MGKKSRWWLVGIIALILVLFGLKKTGLIGKDATIMVAVEKAETRTITETVNATGKIFPEVEVKVSADISGEVTELYVQEGDSVKKGQVLANIYQDNHRNNQQQQGLAALAQQQFPMAAPPINNGTKATLVAPITGVISYLGVKKGERVVGTATMAGTEAMRVADFKHMEIRVDVSENDIPKVKIGDTAIITVDAYVGQKFKGIVYRIANTQNGAANMMAMANDVTNYKVYIHLLANSYNNLIDPNNPKNIPFRPGMTASADIQTKTEIGVVAVPINAVTTRDKNDDTKTEKGTDADDPATTPNPDDEAKPMVVFVLQPTGTVKKTIVTTGLQDSKFIEISTGLKGGEQVVSEPYNTINTILKDGLKVKVVPKNKLFEPK